MGVEIRPLSYAMGAEVRGLDLTRPVGDEDWAVVHQAFLDRGLLLVRGQRITREQHIAFSRRFGELDRHDNLPKDRDPRHPELLMVTNDAQADGSPSNSRYTGQLWHSDMSFTLRPALGSLLRAVDVPMVGGDTMFANMVLAYDALSSGMKKLIADLHGIHHSERKNSNLSAEWEAENRRLNPPIAQPIVRVHPETGRKALYIGEKVKCFEGMTPEESQPLIDVLIRHATRPQFAYRHVWQPNDLLIWDNRSTMHLALGDYDPALRRHLERTTVLGTPSGHVAQLEVTA
ncbi:TauD/TfdA dioxygenase family protein [Piscinibacter koreensis]|uniref:TauD/TfdA family dioxygenase n=1 Tax=Piscinibacter koreensis TaxID=2742824 RepID=A0A7Y6NPE1_9BURK|nr:TauD/TfdA family dioxygenase [Schlegelella koreensis]NUZ06910.1 TauD/TfdA family dioxygenase [Schlegelella koreensis]